MRVIRATLIGAAVAAMMAPAAGYAQSAAADWNGNFTFRSQSERLVDLAQAMVIRRAEDRNYRKWREQLQSGAPGLSSLNGIGANDGGFYGSDRGFISVDRSGDFWAGWSAAGVTVGLR